MSVVKTSVELQIDAFFQKVPGRVTPDRRTELQPLVRAASLRYAKALAAKGSPLSRMTNAAGASKSPVRSMIEILTTPPALPATGDPIDVPSAVVNLHRLSENLSKAVDELCIEVTYNEWLRDSSNQVLASTNVQMGRGREEAPTMPTVHKTHTQLLAAVATADAKLQTAFNFVIPNALYQGDAKRELFNFASYLVKARQRDSQALVKADMAIAGPDNSLARTELGHRWVYDTPTASNGKNWEGSLSLFEYTKAAALKMGANELDFVHFLFATEEVAASRRIAISGYVENLAKESIDVLRAQKAVEPDAGSEPFAEAPDLGDIPKFTWQSHPGYLEAPADPRAFDSSTGLCPGICL